MELITVLELLKDYDITTVVVGISIYLLLSKKIKIVDNAVNHVDKAVNNRGADELTLSQEVTLIRKELGLFKIDSGQVLKDFKLLRKEGYLVAAELKADINHMTSNIKQSSDSNSFLIRQLNADLVNIKKDINNLNNEKNTL